MALHRPARCAERAASCRSRSSFTPGSEAHWAKAGDNIVDQCLSIPKRLKFEARSSLQQCKRASWQPEKKSSEKKSSHPEIELGRKVMAWVCCCGPSSRRFSISFPTQTCCPARTEERHSNLANSNFLNVKSNTYPCFKFKLYFST